MEAHRLACPDSKRRIEEQQHYTAAHRQARQDHATRREEQQRNTAAHQLARADPQYRAHEQQTSNARRQQVSTSRLPSLMALNYHPDNFSYTAYVGTLSVECSHCGALKFPGETAVLKVMSNWSHFLNHSHSCSTCMRVQVVMVNIS